MRWDSVFLIYLELGWCLLIILVGFKLILCKVLKILILEYLGLCLIGGGEVLNDEIFFEMIVSILKG